MDAIKVREFTEATTWAKRILYVSIGVHCLSLVIVILGMITPDTFSDIFPILWMITWVLGWISSILNCIFILIWVYRANANGHEFGAVDMSYSPGWAAGCYFVPFLNFWFSYSSMRELWRVSKDPLNWQRESASSLVLWWWILLVGTFFFSAVSRTLSKGDAENGALGVAFLADLVWHLLYIPLCAVTLELIEKIHAMQMDYINRQKPLKAEI